MKITIYRAILLLSLFLFSVYKATIVNAGNGSPKIIILEIHGLKSNIIADNLKTLPNFSELILGSENNQAYIYLPKVHTTIPAASQPGIAAMYTGIYPQRNGVVSTIWFDRTTAKVNTLISYSQQRINNILIKNNIKSIFDYVSDAGKTSLTVMLMLTKGANWSMKSGSFFWGNAVTANVFENGRWDPNGYYVDNRTMSALLTGRILSYEKSLSNFAKHNRAFPDLTVVQLLGTDLFSHYPPKYLSQPDTTMDEIQKTHMEKVLDPELGRLIGFLKRSGFYENTIFILVSEHGFLKILKQFSDKIVDNSLMKAFKLPDFNTTTREAEATIMIGAFTKEIYLKNRETYNWIDPPRLLRDIKPAVDLLLENRDINNCLDTLIIRQYPNERNEGVREDDQWWAFDRHNYQGSTQDDGDFFQALLPLSSFKKKFELGDFLVQGLRKQYTRETAPDIKLINKKGYYFIRDFDKYGHHGSYYPDDCIVSFWIAGPGLDRIVPDRHTLNQSASTMDLVPMVAHLLGIPQPKGLDGKNPLQDLKTR